jgi:NAD+ synthase
MNNITTIQKIVRFLKKNVGNKPVILGLSGGIDSALVAYLAVRALEPKKVHTLIMPSDTNTAQDLRLGKLVAKNLNLKSKIINIKSILDTYKNIIKPKDQKIIGNLKARIRMSLLYTKANELNGVVLGTGNKTELSIGYFTKYGDGGVDLLPIGNLYKTQVRELAKELKIPQEIIDRPPTAGLWDGQTDEGEVGITYEVLDQILEAIEKKKSLTKFKNDDIKKVKMMIKNSRHKRQLPPICE